MEKHHPNVPHFGLQLKDEAAIASQLLEQVQEDPDALRTVAKKKECHLWKGLHPAKKESTIPMPTTKVESPSSESSDTDYEPPSATSDSSSDSSDGSDSESSETPALSSTPAAESKDPKPEPLSLAQMEAVHEGATGLQGEPMLESLLKYLTAWKQPLSSVPAVQDQPPRQTPVAMLDSTLVMADIPDPSTTPADDLNDMPELEKMSPQKFPFPPKKHCKQEGD